jgi:phenylpropionate dioxygenase-like ring-hydroxylating dioxygenase large terminal subunit
MRSRVTARYYTDEEAFRAEQERLFGRLWQFFTLKVMVARDHAFVSRTIGGRPIVLQNFSGELRAFDNLCLHRQAPLQIEPEGVRPLVCRYHAWRYQADGVARVPFDELYRYSDDERASLRLRAYPIQVVGNLVFICLSDDPLPLEEQFSPGFLDSLRACSSVFDDEVILTTFRARCNWKLAYENLRDAHHPRFVHAQTLAKSFTFSPWMDEGRIAEARALNASKEPLSREAALALLRRFSWGGLEGHGKFQPVPWHDEVERHGTDEGYYNWLAFPNLHIASASGGRSFTIEHHQPVAPDRTDLLVHFVTARKRTAYPTSPAVLYAHMTASQRVLAEDIDIMERVQAGLCDDACAHLGDYEHINAVIDRWYAGVMEGEFVL